MAQFGYCALYQEGRRNEHQFCASYNPSPMQEVDPINLSYIGKLSPRLTVFGELTGKPDGSKTDSVLGAKIRFKDSSVTGYLGTNMKAHSTYTKMLGQMMQIDLCQRVDFKNPRNCLFGVNFNFTLG
jgi:hypothetical protein